MALAITTEDGQRAYDAFMDWRNNGFLPTNKTLATKEFKEAFNFTSINMKESAFSAALKKIALKAVCDMTDQDYEDVMRNVKKDRRTQFSDARKKAKESFNSPCTNNQSRRISSGRIDTHRNDTGYALSDEDDDNESADDSTFMWDTASDLHVPILDVESPKQKRGRKKSGSGGSANDLSQLVTGMSSLSFHPNAFTVRKGGWRNAIVIPHLLGEYCIVKFELQGYTGNADAHKFTFENGNTALSYYYRVPEEKTDVAKMLYGQANAVDNMVITAALNKRYGTMAQDKDKAIWHTSQKVTLPFEVAPCLLNKEKVIVFTPTIVRSPDNYAVAMIWLEKFVKTSQNEPPTVGQYISLSKPPEGTAYPTGGVSAGFSVPSTTAQPTPSAPNEVQRLQDQLSKAEAYTKSMEEKLASYRRSLFSKEKEIEAMKQEFHQKLSEAQAEAQLASSKSESMVNQTSELRSNCQSRVKDLEEQLLSKNIAMEKLNLDAQAEIQKAKSAYDAVAKSDIEAAVAKATLHLQSDVTKLKQECHNLSNKKASMDSMYASRFQTERLRFIEMENKLAEKNTELERQLGLEKEALQSQLQNAMKENTVVCNEHQLVSDKLDQVSQELEEYKAAFQQKHTDFDLLQKELEASHEQVVQFKHYYKSIKSDLGAAQKKLAWEQQVSQKLTVDMEALQSQLQNVREEKIAACNKLNEQLLSFQAAHVASQRKVEQFTQCRLEADSDLQAAVNGHKLELDQLKKHVSASKDHISQLQTMLDESKDDFAQQLQEKDGRIKVLNLAIDGLNRNLEEAGTREKDVLTRAGVLESESKNHISQLQRMLDESKDDFAQQLQEKDDRIKELDLAIDGLNRNLEEAGTREKDVLTRAGVLESESKDHISQLQRRMDESKDDFAQQLQEKDDRIKELDLATDGLKRNLEEAGARTEDALTRAAVLESESSQLQKRMDELNNNISERLEEKDELIEELKLSIGGLNRNLEEAGTREKAALARAGVMDTLKTASENLVSSLQVQIRQLQNSPDDQSMAGASIAGSVASVDGKAMMRQMKLNVRGLNKDLKTIREECTQLKHQIAHLESINAGLENVQKMDSERMKVMLETNEKLKGKVEQLEDELKHSGSFQFAPPNVPANGFAGIFHQDLTIGTTDVRDDIPAGLPTEFYAPSPASVISEIIGESQNNTASCVSLNTTKREVIPNMVFAIL